MVKITIMRPWKQAAMNQGTKPVIRSLGLPKY